MTITTNLIGGLIFLGVSLSILDFSIFPSFSSGNYSILFTIVLAVFSIPVGYLFNQFWMLIYNFWSYPYIFLYERKKGINYKTYRKKVIKNGKFKYLRFNRAFIYEVNLAFLHRKDILKEPATYISWYRNKLTTIHSNGVSALSLIFGYLFCIVIGFQFSDINYFISFSDFIHDRWFITVIVVVFLIINILRIIYISKVIRTFNLYCLSKKEQIQS